MPRVIITAGAAQGLERCRRFLVEKNPQAAVSRAVQRGEKFAEEGGYDFPTNA